MKGRLITGIVGAILFAAFTACSDSTSPATVNESQVSADVAVTVADGTAEDLNFIYTNEGAFGGAPMASVSGGFSASVGGSADDPNTRWAWHANCTFNPSSQRFECPPMTRNGFTLIRSYALFDAAGVSQSAFDANLTASANFISQLSGTVDREGWTASVERNRDMTVTGLEGHEIRRTWNGTGTATSQGRHQDERGVREYVLNTSIVVANVIVALPRVDNPWPLSGTITRTVTGHWVRDGVRTVRRVVSRTAVVTFNGTSIVPLDIGDEDFCLDLATGRRVEGVDCR